MVSRPVDWGGLGFGYKWNMGWMHDTLDYMRKDPIHRHHHHGDILFGLHYAFSENFVLPLSHDEVVHGKGSLIGRMPGDAWQRFANLRAYSASCSGIPARSCCSWAASSRKDASGTTTQSGLASGRYEPHHGDPKLVRDSIRSIEICRRCTRLDCAPEGFDWVITDDANRNVFAWLRKGIRRARAVSW